MSTWTRPDFAKSIKDKYPVYKDWDDGQLVDAMLEKYPAYKDQVETPAGAFARAVPAPSSSQGLSFSQAITQLPKAQIGQSMQNLGALKESNPTEYTKQAALAKEAANIQPGVKYSATVGATKDVPYSLSRVVDNIANMINYSNQISTPVGLALREHQGKSININDIQKESAQDTAMFTGYRSDVQKYFAQPNVQRALNNPTFWQNIARTAPNVAAQLVEIAALTPLAGPGALFLQSYVQDYDLPVKDQIKAQLTNLAFMGAGKIGGKVAGATLKGSGMGARIARNLAVRTTQAGAGYATTKLSGGTDVQAQSAGALGFALPAGTKGLGEEPAAPPPGPRPIRGLLGAAPADVAAAGRPDSVLITTQFPQQPYGSRIQNTEAGPITTQKGETGFGALGVRRVPTPIAEEFHSQLGTFIESEAFGQLHPIEQAELLRLQTQVGDNVAKAKEAAPGTGLMKPGEAGEGTVAVPTNLQIGGKTVGVEHFKQVIRTHLDSGETGLVGQPMQQPLTLASFEGHLESPTNEPLRAGLATERGTASGLPAGQIRVGYDAAAEHLKALESMTFAVGKKGPVTLPDGTPVLKKSFKTKSSYEQEMILNEINRLRVEIPKANQFQKPAPNTVKGTEDPNAPLPEPGGSFLVNPQGGPNAPRPQSPNVGTNQGVPPGPDVPGNEGQVRQGPSGSPGYRSRTKSPQAQNQTTSIQNPIVSGSTTKDLGAGGRIMKNAVVSPSDQLQVLKPVISSVPVDVMNNFGGVEATSKMLLHDPTMLKNLLSVLSNSDIASLSTSLEQAITAFRAKLPDTGTAGRNRKFLSTLNALQQNLREVTGTLSSDRQPLSNLDLRTSQTDAPLGAKPGSSQPPVGNREGLSTESAGQNIHNSIVSPLSSGSGGTEQGQQAQASPEQSTIGDRTIFFTKAQDEAGQVRVTPPKENPNAPTSSPSTGGPPDYRPSVSVSSDPLQQRGSNVPEASAEVHQTVNPTVSGTQASGEASQPPSSQSSPGPTAPPEAFGGSQDSLGGSAAKPGQKGAIDPDLLDAPWRIAKKVAEFVGGAKAAPKAETAEALPAPGAATPFNDMSRVQTITSNFKTANKVLLEHPETAPLMDGMQRAQDKKIAFIGTTLRTLSSANKGLSGLAERKLAGELARTQETPADMQAQLGAVSPKYGIRYSQAAIDSAIAWRNMSEQVHSMFPPKAGPKGTNVGYIPRYLTQMESLVGDTDLQRGIQQIWDYSIKGGLHSTIDAFKQNPILKPKTGGAFDKFTTDPSSPYVRHRSGKIENLEDDITRIEAAYVNSAAKVIFDRPMIQNAKLQAMAMPQSALRDFATATIKNVARYDAHPELDRAWTAMTSSVLKTYARSVLGLNPVVAGYHAYRLFTDVWPAIETKYLAQGAAEFGKNPLKSMQETARLGLIPSDVKPWSFKTIGEKGNAMLQLFSIGDYFSRAVGYQSFKAKYLAEGLSPEEATLKAITQTKNTTQLVDPIRTQRLLFGKGPEGGLIHLITQFKQQPTMIAEQYIDILKNSREDPAAFAKLGASLIGGIAIMQLSGFKALHLAPSIWTGVGGGLGEFLDSTRKFGAALIDMSKWHYAKDDYDRETYAQRAKQNIEQLVINLAKDITPGGWSVTRQIAHGKPGFMEPTPKEPARETRPRRVEKSLKDMVFK